VFLLVTYQLFPEDAARRGEFFGWRCGAEGKAWQRVKGREVGIADIYADETLHRFGEYSAEEMMRTEMEMEREMLTPYPVIASTIRRLRGDGERIAFISDMYLPTEFLQETLLSCGVALPEDPVYVSVDCNARKDNGSLYDKVRGELTPSDWEHYGDNLRSDVAMAEQKGIRAHAVKNGFDDAEQLLMFRTRRSAYAREVELLTGYARAYRLLHDGRFDVQEATRWMEGELGWAQLPEEAWALWRRGAEKLLRKRNSTAIRLQCRAIALARRAKALTRRLRK
jgi:FMN phosphatase YigB (HAD superfamily)